MTKPHLRHLSRGGELLRADRVDEACVELETAHALKPGDGKIMNLLGLTYFRLERYPEAAKLYRALRERQPKDAGIRRNLGLVLLKTNDVDEAIGELEATRDLEPEQARTHGYLGLAYARAGRFAEARQSFLRAGQDELAREMEQHLTGAAPAREAEPVAVVATAEAEAVPAMPYLGGESEASMVSDITRQNGQVIAAPTTRMQISALMPGMPVPLAEFTARRLVRPEEGDVPVELGAGGTLVLRVRGRLYARTAGVVASGGDLSYEPLAKRMRGKATEESFGAEDQQMFTVSGGGHLVVLPRGGVFAAIRLDDDVIYVREHLVFAFEESLGWENGQVPGSGGSMPVVQLRGDGALALRTKAATLGVEVVPGKLLFVDAAALVGWSGRVVPKVVTPAADESGVAQPPFVECSGEGVVLLEPAAESGAPLVTPGPEPAPEAEEPA